MPKATIGIDPDKLLNGFAVYHIETDTLELFEFDLYDTFNKLLWYNLRYELKVRLESGHKVTGYWQKRTIGTAKSVGENHNVGFQLERFLKKNNIKYELVKPFGGSSIKHEMFCRITNWDIKKLTNPEKRVAGLLAYKH